MLEFGFISQLPDCRHDNKKQAEQSEKDAGIEKRQSEQSGGRRINIKEDERQRGAADEGCNTDND